MLSPRRLAVLREFAAAGHDRGAAEALAFTPSAVSQQLAQLQREAGVELFRKVGRRLELTDAGRTLAARADELLARVEQVEAELAAEAGDVRGTVRVAAFQTAATALACRPRPGSRTPIRALRVEFAEAEAEESLPMLARGGLDVAIAEEYEHAPRPRLPGCSASTSSPTSCSSRCRPRHRRGGRAGRAGRVCASSPWATPAPAPPTPTCRGICRSRRRVRARRPPSRQRLGLLLELVAAGRRRRSCRPWAGRARRRVAVRPIAEGRFSRALFVAVRDERPRAPGDRRRRRGALPRAQPTCRADETVDLEAGGALELPHRRRRCPCRRSRLDAVVEQAGFVERLLEPLHGLPLVPSCSSGVVLVPGPRARRVAGRAGAPGAARARRRCIRRPGGRASSGAGRAASAPTSCVTGVGARPGRTGRVARPMARSYSVVEVVLEPLARGDRRSTCGPGRGCG